MLLIIKVQNAKKFPGLGSLTVMMRSLFEEMKIRVNI